MIFSTTSSRVGELGLDISARFSKMEDGKGQGLKV